MVFVFLHPPSEPLPCFLVQLFLTICVTRTCGKVLSYLKQPPVIGEILGGIILGPSVLGQIPGFSSAIFPQATGSIKSQDTFGVFANMGLILFMFLMGMELDPSLLRWSWRKSVPIALSGIAVPFGVGALCSLWWHRLNDEDPPEGWQTVDFTAMVLFSGTSLSFTAFPVLASLLKSFKMLNTNLGALCMSTAALDDIMAWCMLAIASSFSKSGNAADGGYTCLLAAGYCAVMVLAIRPILRMIHDNMIARGNNPATDSKFTTLLFLVLVVSAFTAEVIGIHAFFGSFVAGLIVPKHGGVPLELEPKIELLVREILLPLFFANSGIRTDIGALNTARYWGITLVVIIIATFAKVAPIFVTTKLITKEKTRFCATMAIFMNTRGLVELIALNVALKLKILSPRLFTIFVLMAIATTAMTAPIVWFIWLRHQQRKQQRTDSNKGQIIAPCPDETTLPPEGLEAVPAEYELDAAVPYHRPISVSSASAAQMAANAAAAGTPTTTTDADEGVHDGVDGQQTTSDHTIVEESVTPVSSLHVRWSTV